MFPPNDQSQLPNGSTSTFFGLLFMIFIVSIFILSELRFHWWLGFKVQFGTGIILGHLMKHKKWLLKHFSWSEIVAEWHILNRTRWSFESDHVLRCFFDFIKDTPGVAIPWNVQDAILRFRILRRFIIWSHLNLIELNQNRTVNIFVKFGTLNSYFYGFH